MIVTLCAEFMQSGLVVPAGKQRIEYCDSTVPGLLVECRATANAIPTYYLRFKRNGKTAYDRLGSIKELSLTQARKLATQRKVEHQQAAKVAPEQKPAIGEMTLDTFWTEHYLPHAKIHKRSWKRDEQLYRIRIKPRFGTTPVSEITRYQVQQFQNDLAQENLSPSSQDHHIKLLRRFLSLANQWDFVQKNVLKGIPLRNIDNRVENCLNDEQLARLVSVLRDDGNHTVAMVILLLISTGMRKSEALTATWRNIELDAGVMRIDATRAKGKRSRVLPLNDSAKWVIGQLKSKGTSEFLFPSPASGRPFSTISRVWYRIRKVAGIPENVRLHDLRHSWLSLLARRGCSQVQLQHLAGHADYRTTLRYIHWSENDLCVASNLGSMIVPKEKPTATLPPAPTEASTSQPEVGAVVEQEVQSAQILVFSKAA